jgi:hypothetical protein
MKTHVFRGSKQEIADRLMRISGEVREAIVFEDELARTDAAPGEAEDIFAEMAPFMVDAPKVDDSREAIYAPVNGE